MNTSTATTEGLNIETVMAAAAEAEQAELGRARRIAELAGAGWVRVDLPGDAGFDGDWDGLRGAQRMERLRAALPWEAKQLVGRDGRLFLMVGNYGYMERTRAAAEQAHDLGAVMQLVSC